MNQNQNSNRDKKKLDSSSSISDSSATNPKQLLNTYIYDFLVKNKLPQTAKTFVNEADISSQDENNQNSGNSNPSPTSPGFLQYQKDNNLPIVKVTMDAPQSFLFEWWQVFWDVFQAKNNNKQSTQAAMQYYQLQLMKQRQQLDASTMNMMNVVNYQGNGTGTVNPMQSQQQRLMMQYMRQQQQNGQPSPPGPPQQPSNQPANGQNPNGQQMYMMQNLPQNGIQQHAQNQMNNLRLQAAAQKQNDGNSPNPNIRPPNNQNFPPQNGQPGNFPPPNGPVMRTTKEIEDSNQPANHSRNANALQDYQMQLMLLEKQNKKRLDIARNSGNEGNMMTSMNNNMLPPNQQQLQQALNNGMTSNINNLPMNGLPPQNIIPNNINTKPSPATGPSPVIGNKPSPTNANGKKKKEPAKRGRKPSVANNGNNSNVGTPISAPTPSHLKKEISTPLTPTSETPNENGKRKRKNESPKKNGKFKKESIKEENEEKNEDIQPEESHNCQEINNDPMFSMDVLESNSNDNLFNQNGIDDIEFDFNMFLDGNVNDDITNFNWGDGIEGE